MPTLTKPQEIVVLAAAYDQQPDGSSSEHMLNFTGEPTREDIRRALQAEVEATYIGQEVADKIFEVLDRNLKPDGSIFAYDGDPEHRPVDGKVHIVMNDEYMASRRVLLHEVS